MASVGFGADVGMLPISEWNNPEPEMVMVVAASGAIVGATLGNDVNLRDVEGRRALLLGKAKDNNASLRVGPFIRLFDGSFTHRRRAPAEIALSVDRRGRVRADGAELDGQISRDPLDSSAAIGPHHQYPDGFVLFLGTMFAPAKDRGAPGKGFTHKTRRHRHDLDADARRARQQRPPLRPKPRPGPTAPAR